nr:helix-turn-helix domain-containing protein [Polyangium aurulentum]
MPRRKNPDPLAIKLGARIRAVRVEKKMSVVQLANAAGLSKGHLSSIEHGRAVFNVVTADKLAKGLGLKLMALVLFPEESPLEQIVEHICSMSPEQLEQVREKIFRKAPSTKTRRARGPGRG